MGTIVLVALGVIILPGLLDGQKSIIRMSSPPFLWYPNPAIAMSRI
jgi:cell division septation protein DedD